MNWKKAGGYAVASDCGQYFINWAHVMGALVFSAVAGSTIAPLLQVVAQRRLPPGRIGLLFALEPVFALAFALTLGAERFAVRWWTGAALILSAVVLVEWRAAASARS